MNRFLQLCIVLVATFVYQSAAWANDKRISITGSSTVAPLILEIAKRYEKLHEGSRIDVQTGGSSRGINDVRRGLVDIGMVSRSLKTSEADLTPHLIALDGIGVILHKSNTIQTLSNQQIVDIFQGKIKNWQELGAQDKPITVVNKAEGRSTLELFLKHFALKNSQIKAHVIIGDNQQGIKTVSGNAGAIGYVSIGTAEYEEERGTSIKRVSISGHKATVNSVANGTYPLARQLNLISKGELPPLAEAFIAFAQSSKVNDLIEKQFFVSP